ncbi:MAG: acetyl-CoA carboxylase carboxyl transferase subunit beta [Candidatus Neomarinimicrobiota bacterium]|nr:acetyl-CoA carboxylase carboxyltransferase subunit beta [Candidatus Neomarinimicrobiota bacterium]MCD6099598.1 acetyl-CoA carboxylase carboxyltransferase subunit beta [Candidatus Neomarinimicrobiota bacterium]RKY44743.1 MAG: acetyl-CoA carboxylase carboxyl transferase subunit beta [Candidatus Neomarinimicrobiota bacterium]RKY48384.1 MAG: acetyl-CoA carboxylase carboxyl transferase subunit beta [Candidatus Neomarinimicrobiota bacterium]RKY54397.1 MAG: acetyl-CoA carboxylase carboxyl transfera
MAWFKRTKKGLLSTEKKDIPDGLWTKCPACSEFLYRRELEKNFWVCKKCGYHFRVSSDVYLKIIMDEEYEEFNENLRSNDPLRFKALKKYSEQIKSAVTKTGMNEAIRTVIGTIGGIGVVMGVMDFRFIGGSMGSVVGEKVARAVDRAIELERPLIIISQSGGARMMEGVLSLMQMAKTSARLTKLHEKGLPYISIMADPTTGGTTASYAMLGDIHIAEPGALIGFAGPRVIKQTIGQDLPEGFQRAEFLLEKGFVDIVCKRSELRDLLIRLLRFFT